VLQSPCEPVDEMVTPLLLKIVGPEFMVGFVTGQHMERTDDDGMRHSPNGPFLPTACGQAMISGRQVGPFGPCSGVGYLRQAGPQGAIALASLP
jgi:hypothetical protein